MIRLDIMAEWKATGHINSKQAAQLDAAGIGFEARERAGGIGWTRARITGRLWQPSPAGNVHLVLPVWIGGAPSIFSAVEEPALADLLAFRLDDPTAWFRRTGRAGAVLGDDHLSDAHEDGTALLHYMTPLDWLQSGCRGTVLLDYCEARWSATRQQARAAAVADWYGGSAA